MKCLVKHGLKLEEEDKQSSPIKKQENVYVELPPPEKVAEMEMEVPISP